MEKQIVLAAPEIVISYQPNMKMSDRPVVTSSRESVEVLRPFFDQNLMEFREEAKLMVLNTSGRVLGVFPISIGGTKNTVIDVTEVFLLAVRTPGACSIMLAHNHPSGCLRPSYQDELLTRRIREGAILLGLKLVDHLILSCDGYYSMADEGMV